MTSEFFSASAAPLGPRVQRHEEGVRCVGACSRVGACECGVTIASPPFLVYGQSRPIFCNFERGLPYWSALTPHSGATTRQTPTRPACGRPPRFPSVPCPGVGTKAPPSTWAPRVRQPSHRRLPRAPSKLLGLDTLQCPQRPDGSGTQVFRWGEAGRQSSRGRRAAGRGRGCQCARVRACVRARARRGGGGASCGLWPARGRPARTRARSRAPQPV